MTSEPCHMQAPEDLASWFPDNLNGRPINGTARVHDVRPLT